jgi:ABC-type polysaccharide/polyol phosphate transport system ATPase subunit
VNRDLDTGPIGSVSMRGVTKHFGSPGACDVAVLDDVNLHISPQESVGIIGPNGAGKSTLLKLIAGVTAPTAGSITRVGRTCTVIELGAAVHPDLTGRENAQMLGALFGIPRRRLPRLLDEMVEFAELQHAIDWQTRQYSSGMVARLAFAVAAFSDPDLLLLDEVLSVGDLPFQLRCRERVEELRQQGTTLVMVSHDMELIAGSCDRTILLRGGGVESDGRTTAVVSRYLGLPDPTAAPESALELRTEHPRVVAGEPLRLTAHHEASTSGGTLSIDFVVATHPTLLQLGIDQSIIFGSVALPFNGHSGEFDLETRHLPPGRYQVHAQLTTASTTAVAAPVEVTLTGPRPDLLAAQLDATWSLASQLGTEHASAAEVESEWL